MSRFNAEDLRQRHLLLRLIVEAQGEEKNWNGHRTQKRIRTVLKCVLRTSTHNVGAPKRKLRSKTVALKFM